MKRLLLAVACCAVLSVALVPSSSASTKRARAAQSDYLTVYAPGYFDSATEDEPVRFSWYPNRSQDAFSVVFSQYRSFGWETSPYQSPETRLTFGLFTPRSVGLTPGEWYWRICYSWDDRPNCYLDTDIRSLTVEEEPEPLYLGSVEARRVAKRLLARRYTARDVSS